MILASVAALGCGMVGGLLFAFSNSVMTALSHQPPASGIRTMQAINAYILNPLFFTLFFGTAVASVVLAVVAAIRLQQPGAPLILAASTLYLLGAIGITAVFNVPMNDRLAKLNPETVEAAHYWVNTYLSEWVKWNHVRTIACVAATGLFLVAIRQLQSVAK